jgi:hypothetical protein
LLAAALLCAPAPDVRLADDGWFRDADGKLFLPLGGFHGNMIPLSEVELRREELERVEKRLWTPKESPEVRYLDIVDAPDHALRAWFRKLHDSGVTAVRLFPRAHIGRDVLDLCGKLNPELRRAFDRAFAAARPHKIRFLLQILPEPALTSYWYAPARKEFVLPRFSAEELRGLAPAQRRFLFKGKQAESTALFTDPDVLACQRLYLAQALDWVERTPEIFALEVYNEQGLRPRDAPRTAAAVPDWEEAEIAWTAKIVREIKQRLPGMPVTISHPGYGLTGYDPLAWSARTGVDFYSSHFYSGQSGENESVDFAALTAATTAILGAGIVNFPGEWGVLDASIPAEIRRRAHRDAIWLTLMAGAPGFMQWTYDFMDEYRRVERVFRTLPKRFSPTPATIGMRAAYREYHEPRRYVDSPGRYPFLRDKRTDPNLRQMLDVYRRRLDGGGVLRAIGGYQVACLEDRRNRAWIGYLRSREVRQFGNTWLGVPVTRPLQLELDLPEGEYTLALFDLDTGKRKRHRAARKVRISEATDRDYAFVITPR